MRYAIVRRPPPSQESKPFHDDMQEAAAALIAARKLSQFPDEIVLVEIDDDAGTVRDIAVREIVPSGDNTPV